MVSEMIFVEIGQVEIFMTNLVPIFFSILMIQI